MKDANELRQLLSCYTGSELVYRHNQVHRFNYTEGARAFFQNAGQGAYWLADILATEPLVFNGAKNLGFCLVVLHVEGTKASVVVSKDGSEQSDANDAITGYQFDNILYTQSIDYTDCPEGFWSFYLTWTQVGESEVALCMLPREY